VIDLSALGAQGTPSGANKPFSVTAAQVGQVFGVALDSAPQPDIFLAATSAYGLSIFTPDAGGLPQRIHTGAAGAAFVAGQFGPGGGPSSIWRVDGTTCAVTPFATVDISRGSVAGLGGLAFDRASQQLFAVDRGTGIIYRFGLDGRSAALTTTAPRAGPPRACRHWR
jgi:hypothetical protein